MGHRLKSGFDWSFVGLELEPRTRCVLNMNPAIGLYLQPLNQMLNRISYSIVRAQCTPHLKQSRFLRAWVCLFSGIQTSRYTAVYHLGLVMNADREWITCNTTRKNHCFFFFFWSVFLSRWLLKRWHAVQKECWANAMDRVHQEQDQPNRKLWPPQPDCGHPGLTKFPEHYELEAHHQLDAKNWENIYPLGCFFLSSNIQGKYIKEATFNFSQKQISWNYNF